MLSSGNSEVGPCSYCLLATTQREVPFARSKGIDPDVYDMPPDEAASYLDESARDVLSAYEKRIDVESAELDFGMSDGGDGTRYTVAVSQSTRDPNDDYEEDDE